METSKTTYWLIRITLRPIRIPIMAVLLYYVFIETRQPYLVATLFYMALVFDMILILVSEQHKILELTTEGMGASAKVVESQNESLTELEDRVGDLEL